MPTYWTFHSTLRRGIKGMMLIISLLHSQIVFSAQSEPSTTTAPIGTIGVLVIIVFGLLSLFTFKEYVLLRRARKTLFDARAEQGANRIPFDEPPLTTSPQQPAPPATEFSPPTKPKRTKSTLPGLASSVDNILELSSNALGQGFYGLVTPIERYFNQNNLRHILKANPSTMQWLNVIETMRNQGADDDILSLLQSIVAPEDLNDRQTTDLNQICSETVSALEKLFPQLVIENQTTGSIYVLTWPDNLKRALTALLLNAIEEHQSIKSSRPIKLNTRYESDAAFVDVQDFGLGVEPELLRDIFKPGTTRHENATGRGHGLSVVRQFCQASGPKSLIVRSKPREGSTFTVKLPLA